MTINYYTKNVYGNELIYLANPSQAQDWYVISGGKKTITEVDMRRLTNLTGIEFNRVFEAETK